MSGLGEEVMVLEGLDRVDDWPGPGWAYRDIPRTFALKNMSDFPKLPGTDESSIKNDKKEGLSDLPFTMAAGAAGKLRYRPAVGPRSKNRKRQKQEEQAKVGMVRNAAADPNNPKSKRIAKLLSIKNKNLDKLAKDRFALSKKSAALVRGNASVVKKLDNTIVRMNADLQKNDPSMTPVDRQKIRHKIQKVSNRRAIAARNAVRYSKLDTLSRMMAQNAALQSDLSIKAAAAVNAGDPRNAEAYAEAIRQVGDKSHQLKTVRENQKRLWTIQNKQTSYKRHTLRLVRVSGEIARLEIKSRTSGLSAKEQDKLSTLQRSAIAIKKQLSKAEGKMNHEVRLGPTYQRPVDPMTRMDPPIGADAAHAYSSGSVMARLDEETFMAPEGADLYPEIERSRTVLNPASFLNQTFLAGFTEALPPATSAPMYPTLKAICSELSEASDTVLRENFSALSGLGLDPRAFYPLGRA